MTTLKPKPKRGCSIRRIIVYNVNIQCQVRFGEGKARSKQRNMPIQLIRWVRSTEKIFVVCQAQPQLLHNLAEINISTPSNHPP